MITLLPCQPPAHAPARAKRCCRQPRGHLPRTTVDLSAPQGPGLSCACCPGVRSLGSYMEGRKDQAVERIRGRQGCRQQHARGCGMLGLGRGWWHTSGKPLCELVRPPIYPEGTLCARPSTPGHTVRTPIYPRAHCAHALVFAAPARTHASLPHAGCFSSSRKVRTRRSSEKACGFTGQLCPCRAPQRQPRGIMSGLIAASANWSKGGWAPKAWRRRRTHRRTHRRTPGDRIGLGCVPSLNSHAWRTSNTHTMVRCVALWNRPHRHHVP